MRIPTTRQRDTRPLGFFGVGALGATIIGPDGLPINISPVLPSGTPDPNGCYPSGYDINDMACLYLPPVITNDPATVAALNSFVNSPTITVANPILKPATSATATSGISSNLIIMAAAAVGILLVLKR